jgi:chromosomal replication initiation ATPase DnaA
LESTFVSTSVHSWLEKGPKKVKKLVLTLFAKNEITRATLNKNYENK